MIGALIGAGASLIGGLFGKKSAKKQQAAAIAAQEAQSNREYARQKEFAREAIQWKVRDAKRAGVHPLYALGANTVSYAPQSVGGVGYNDPLPGAIADAGQNIGRAIDSGLNSDQRIQHRLNMLSVQRAELENTKLASEIALMSQPGTPPPPSTPGAVIPGQGGIEVTPSKQVSTSVGIPWSEATPTPEIKFAWTPHGELAAVPSQAISEGLESSWMASLGYGLRNHVLPTLGQGVAPSNDWLPPGASHWKFNPFTQAWHPVKPPKGK